MVLKTVSKAHASAMLPEKRRGRPREFDRDAALRSAVEVFWAQGYDGTSILDLQAAMGGIKAPSFYAAFGSKEELFREVLDQYRGERGSRTLNALMRGPTARESVEALLREAVNVFTEPGTPKGCMIMSGMTVCSSDGARTRLRRLRLEASELIRKRLERAAQEGELAKGLDLEAIATYYATVVQGLAMRARDGASRKSLLAAADMAMTAWDASVRDRRGELP